MLNCRDTNEITREFLDSILVEQRLIGSDLPDTSIEIFGKKFQTPIMNAAFSHVQSMRPEAESAAAEMGAGIRAAGALNLWGMCEDDEFTKIAAKDPDTIRIIKPYENEDKIYAQIECAKAAGAIAVGMDIDHAFSRNGEYDVVNGEEMRPKTFEQLHAYIEAAGDLPFVIKGVLSTFDARESVRAGAAAIIVSTHHGILESAVPPLEVLPDIAEEVGGEALIFADGCMDSGMDVFKALALGADAVSVSRHILQNFTKDGAEGVTRRLNEMTGELRSVMARTGCHNLREINSSLLWM
jgi:4-hydroxymandelate oxidase